MSQPIYISPCLTKVDASNKSILPTGRIKIEKNGILQEATVIQHRPADGKQVGIRTEWFPMPEGFLQALQARQ